MEDSLKLLGVWLDLDLQKEKNWNKVTGKMTTLTETWPRRVLSLLGRVEVVQMFPTSVTNYCLIDVPCPDLCLNKLERTIFYFSGTKDKHL